MNEFYEDVAFKEINREKKVRKKKNYLLRFFVFVAIIAGIGLFLSSGFFDVKEIQVEGNQYYSDEEVINLASAKTGGNLFWGISGGEIKDNLLKDPYFTKVKIRRKLPKTLKIVVEERQQTAAIVYGDQFLVIDTEGILLRKGKVDPKITLLAGLKINKLKVGEAVGVEKDTTMRATLKVLDSMRDGDLFFKKIDVSKIVLKAYIYDTLVVKGTAKQLQKAIDNGDLQKVVNNLFKNDMTRGTINLGEHNYMSVSPEF